MSTYVSVVELKRGSFKLLSPLLKIANKAGINDPANIEFLNLISSNMTAIIELPETIGQPLWPGRVLIP